MPLASPANRPREIADPLFLAYCTAEISERFSLHTAIPSAPPFSLVVPTIYGQMIVNRHDINQTDALIKTGRAFDHNQIVILQTIAQAFKSPIEFLDIGANFGVFSLGLAPYVDKVHAFEPQRIIHHMLAGSVALNGLTHVHCHNLAVGAAEGRVEIPQFDYSKPLNFGSVEFYPEQREPLIQTRSHEPDRVEYVPLVTVDSFAFKRAALIKIDAEGMELDVLDGAVDTIRRCRPVLYVEYIKVDKDALQRKTEDFGYAVHLSQGNFLCIPHEYANSLKVVGGT